MEKQDGCTTKVLKFAFIIINVDGGEGARIFPVNLIKIYLSKENF